MTRSALIRARLAAAGTILVAFGAVATFADGAFLGNNPGNIDRDAISTRDGARVQATGPLICSRDERVSLRVTVTQRATRAVGGARWKHACTGAVQHWRVDASAGGDTRFEAGPGRVCVRGLTRVAERITDRRRWCRRVTVSGRF